MWLVSESPGRLENRGADKALADRDIHVVPDLLANAIDLWGI